MKLFKKLTSGFLACSMALSLMSWNTTAATTFEIEAENYVSSDGSFNTLTSNKASGGKYVGDYGPNDILTYKIDIEKAGNYEILVSVGTINKGGIVMANCNGSFSEEATVPNTGAWQTYQNVSLKVWMEAGTQTLTISNLSATWNFDKMIINYLDSEVEIATLEPYQNVYLQNRWKTQRLVERDDAIQYSDPEDDDYHKENATWNLIPDGNGFYYIQNVKTKNYVTMIDGSDFVVVSSNNNTDASKWQIGKLGGRLEFYNKQFVGSAITLEYQADYPDQVIASNASLAKWYSSQWAIETPPIGHYYEISGDKIEGTAGIATSTDGKSITSNASGKEKTWTLSEDLSATPSFSAPNMPMMEAVYNLSMEETLLNIHDGLYGDVFWTGTNWKKVWTRDTAMSVQYSLSWLFPEQTLNSIKEKILGGEEIPKIWEEDTGTGGSYPTSVDRVIMMIACWSLYEVTGDESVLELGYEVTKNTLEQDYHNIYDEASGLFKGETGGLDHRSKTYPDWMDEAEEDSIVNIGESKAGNVNIIFAQALNLMAKSGTILGKDEAEIADWQAKYEALKQTINDRLWLDHRGMYASWEYPEYMGSPVADKVDVIANGYALMFDIASDEQKQQIMENYPMVVYGADTVWPQKNGRRGAAIDHNRGVWPGWEAALMIGSKENGNYQVAEEVFKSCIRVAGMSLSNKELMNFQTGEGVGSNRQLWSIAATLAGYYRLLFGMNYSTEGVTFNPYVPAWMEGPYTLSNYAYRDAILNITVEGNGDTLESIIVNDVVKPLDYVLPTDASGTYNIKLIVSDSGNRSKYHFEADSFAVSPDMPVLNEAADGTLTWEEDSELTYRLWTGSEYVPVEGGSYTPDRSVYGAYSLVAIDEDGITSEMSKPVIISPEGSKYVYEAEDATYDASCFEATAEGFSGTGYVNDFLKKRTDITFDVEVAEDGKYALTTIYNNYGNACEGQDGAMRSVIIDGEDVGTMAFPIVGFDFQRSGNVYVNLLKGTHEITFTYNPDDWYDTNMTTARGTVKNSVSYDTLTLQKVADLDTDRSALEAAKAEYASKDAQIYTPESWEKVVLAYEAACQIDANATQAEIDEVVEALNKALSALEELSFNVTDVEIEVVDYKTIKLTWAPYREATGYVVERFSNEEWIEVEQISEPAFIANGVKTGKTYTYRVKAITANGESDYSEEVSATPMLSGEVELTLTANGTNKFDLSWSQVAGATRYIIYRKTSDGEWQKLLTLGKDATTYTTKAMNPGTYSYMIKAGRYDSIDRVMTNGSNVVEGVAKNEIPTITIEKAEGDIITISWNKVEGMKGYDVYRATSVDGKYTQLKRTAATSITTTVKAGKTYFYKVRGFNTLNNERVYAAYSETISYSAN